MTPSLTPKALALLAKVEARKKAEAAKSLEEKYGGSVTYADRLIDARCSSTSNLYSEIQAMSGNNGDCTTRKGTWRRLKFGKGNIGKRGFEKQGFKENRKPSATQR